MEQQNIKNNIINAQEEPIMIFNDGMIYHARIRNPKPGLGTWQTNEIGFHTAVFYRETDKSYLIVSHREYLPNSQIKGEIDKMMSQEGVENICFNMLIGLLRSDPAKSWYQDKKFVLGERHDESVIDYLKRSNNNANLGNIISKELPAPNRN
ncbi:MAG: hypothetical protein ACP5NW_03185 [Candidatus Woesearchaeota archaeon]